MPQDTAKYGHLLRAVYERPWAIVEEALHELVATLTLAASGQIGREEFEGMLAARGTPGRAGGRTAAVAVIPVRGVISQGQGLLGLLLGGTSVDQVAADFKTAMQDRQVDGVVLDVNSPGGTIDGVEELASLIRSSRGRKPIVAVANGSAESAAYWIASAADSITITPSGDVGSIGVFTAHQDISAMAEREGVKTTLISYGKFKTEGNPWEPLGDEARSSLQDRVNYFGRMFERAVAKGRGVSIDKVRAEFGQGRSFTATDAVRLGMADREATLDETIASVGRGVLQQQEPTQMIAMKQDETPVMQGADLIAETEPEAATRSGAWMHTKTQREIARATLHR